MNRRERRELRQLRLKFRNNAQAYAQERYHAASRRECDLRVSLKTDADNGPGHRAAVFFVRGWWRAMQKHQARNEARARAERMIAAAIRSRP